MLILFKGGGFMEDQQGSKNERSYKSGYGEYAKTIFWLLVTVVIGLIVLFFAVKYLVFPLGVKFVYWLVPNFWSNIVYLFMIWVAYRILRFFWSPIYNILGKWSFVILGATVFYIFLQIS